jgi:hypothetical protein
MKDLSRNALSIFGYAFALLLLGFTAIQTYSLMLTVSGSHLTAAIGLILFEVGMVYWWMVFRNEAKGLGQMAVSLIMFTASLLLVTAAVALKLGAVAPDLLGPATPARIITIAALLNLVAKLLFPLLEPDQLTAITERAHEGRILKRTYQLFETQIDDIADTVANQMAQEWTERTRRQTLASWSNRMNANPSTNPTPSLNGQPIRFQAEDDTHA